MPKSFVVASGRIWQFPEIRFVQKAGANSEGGPTSLDSLRVGRIYQVESLGLMTLLEKIIWYE